MHRSHTGGRGHPVDAAFSAMSVHQLGRTDEAHAALERLRWLMQDPRYADQWESQGFLREAEELIGTGTATDQSPGLETLDKPE